jgi:HSP20 family molecular chaperone IbpA
MRSYPDEWMWARACELIDRAERLHRHFFRPAYIEGQSAGWEPPVDIVETDEAIWIAVALPGVPVEDLGIVIEGDSLLVSGRRRLPTEFRRAMVHRLELPFGRFERRIRLPPRPLELETRELVNGCLTLVLRKMR